ncbi:hypothetical protein KUCAC02_024859 [Chaenocephalus aceratus]|nr:hypothetical protein KUCAC02_031400 [Chaenocephalus aceratus]KAI4797782.1 hypothetical protein KUCAC02_024859 [Chaenocephalus aceratus]
MEGRDYMDSKSLCVIPSNQFNAEDINELSPVPDAGAETERKKGLHTSTPDSKGPAYMRSPSVSRADRRLPVSNASESLDDTGESHVFDTPVRPIPLLPPNSEEDEGSPQEVCSSEDGGSSSDGDTMAIESSQVDVGSDGDSDDDQSVPRKRLHEADNSSEDDEELHGTEELSMAEDPSSSRRTRPCRKAGDSQWDTTAS